MSPLSETSKVGMRGRIGIFASTDPESQKKSQEIFYSVKKNSTALQEASESSHFKIPENSTALQEPSQDLYRKIEMLFAAAREEYFEDEMESKFSKGLISLIKKYDNDAIEVLACVIVKEKVNAEVTSEALRWLGHIDHPVTYRFRLWLLEQSLFSSSAQIRDGAALGLSFLDDPHAIPYLKQAIQREPYEELRKDMEQVLAELESAISAFYSENDKGK